jgi:hypothetical protein
MISTRRGGQADTGSLAASRAAADWAPNRAETRQQSAEVLDQGCWVPGAQSAAVTAMCKGLQQLAQVRAVT